MRWSARLPTLDDLRKKFWDRAVLWSFSLSILLLLDEYVKEGYFFNPYDILVPGTHESLILVFTSFGIYTLCKKRHTHYRDD